MAIVFFLAIGVLVLTHLAGLLDEQAEQEQFGLVVAEGGSKRRDNRASSGGGKRIVKRKVEDDSGGGVGGVSADAASAAKKAKPAASGEAVETLPIPAAPWEPLALAELQRQLAAGVGPTAGDPAGLLEVLSQLAVGGRITVAQLQDSGVGKDVRGLKKHADPKVAAKAAALVAMWKASVELENK
jgi:hypothetical protein